MENWKCICPSSLSKRKLIGQGSFGKIYLCRYKDLNIDVAVKEIIGNVPNALEDLYSEAKKMDFASRSPHVISLYGLLKDSTNHQCIGIVMEYMERGSLDDLLERINPIPWALKFRIIHQVALGMNWVHSLSPPLLHLDLKPKNVLLNADLHVKISDFGLSQFKKNSSNWGACSEDVGGTLEYMPPEAFEKGYRPSKSTDVYSFAILKSTVLTQEDPYPVYNSELIRKDVCNGERPSLETLEKSSSVQNLREALPFIQQCWHQNKTERPDFNVCCEKWENFFKAHETDIIIAVRKVQDKLLKTKGSASTNESIMTGQSTEIEHIALKFKTLNITQETSMKQMAVPPEKMANSQKYEGRPVTMPHPTSPAANQTRAKDYHQQTNPSASKPDQNDWYGKRPVNPGSAARHPGPASQTPKSTIYISGNPTGIQIGNNNSMTIVEGSQDSGSKYLSHHAVPDQFFYKPQFQTSYQRTWGPRPFQTSTQSRGNMHWPSYTQAMTHRGVQPSSYCASYSSKPSGAQFRPTYTQPKTQTGVQSSNSSPLHLSNSRSAQQPHSYNPPYSTDTGYQSKTNGPQDLSSPNQGK
ncbi:receptor-interacting serine/threonine-protein kinase 3 [Bombina bombina]|uniref:receptor-interacting serine/threonine-protein kinase 3 n=1 Tax=Bombina bombina TaxID=8345 RepID=UPI00235B2C91|nr:receptor-interacting serine/threonine-protein kinase 3 [Bombina bombina]